MVQDDDSCIQALINLGLTLLQAKIYLTLAKLRKAGVKRISEASNVARPDVYRVIPTLEKLGLVEKIVTNPTMYKASPLKEGLSILLQQKTEEHGELQKKTKALLSNFQENNIGIALEREDLQFVIASEKKLFLKRFEKAINAGQMSEDFIGTAAGFKNMLSCNLQDFKRAMGRGVKIRAITEKAENQESIPRIVQDLKKNPLFKLKYTSDQCPVSMMICDNKEVNIHISDRPESSLCSNNPHVVKLAAICFESLWNKAHESPDPTRNQKRGSRAKAQNRNNRRHKSAAKIGQTV
jgi:sugar-specific transcriptional regulator TrmB